MSWSGLATNQMVSYTDAQGGGFTLNSGQSSVTSNQCMTKTDALTKYNLVSSNMSSYASNQLVPKSAWVSNGSFFYVPINLSYGIINYFNTYMELNYTYNIYVESATAGNYSLVDYSTYYSSDVDDYHYSSTYVPNDATLFINLDVEIYNPSGRYNQVFNNNMYYDAYGQVDVGTPYASSIILDLNNYDLTGITLSCEALVVLDS